MLLKTIAVSVFAGTYLPVMLASAEDIGVTEFGLAAVVVWIVVTQGISYMKSKDEKISASSGNTTDKYKTSFVHLNERVHDISMSVTTILAKTNALYEWHSVKDQDGAPIWYLGASLTKAVERIADSLGQLTKIQQQLEQDIKAISDRQARVERDLTEIKDIMPKRRAPKVS